MKRLLRLSWAEARLRPLSLVILGLICLLGSGSVILSLSLVDEVASLRLRALQGSSEHILRVRPPEPTQALSMERRLLREDDLHFLSQLPGLRQQRVISGLPLPASMRVHIPGLINSRYDITLYTLDPAAVPEELRDQWQEKSQGAGASQSAEASQSSGRSTVPMILNPQLINLYNLGFADRYRTPRLNKQALLNLSLPLDIGRDLFGSLDTVITSHSGEVIGYSQDLPVWGAGIPQAYAERWLPILYPDGAPEGTGPVLVTLRFGELADFVAARTAISERGLSIDGNTALAEAVLADRRLGSTLSGIAALVMVLVLALATACLTLAVVGERRRSLCLLLHLGAGLRHLFVVFSAGLVLAAALGTLLGCALAALLQPWIVQRLAAALALDAPSAGIPLHLWGTAPLITAGICALGILPLLHRASRRALLDDLLE